jgi:hypothetical protein
MEIHLYFLCNRFEALVASHLEPEAFGRYMSIGSQKNAHGYVLFFEIDPKLKSDYFRLSDIAERCKPTADGKPKRSKYISTYRVLEHLDLSVFGKLYLSTADGRVLALEASEYTDSDDKTIPNLYEELCPVPPMVVSMLPPLEFTKFMTNQENAVSVPRIFFVDMLLSREESGKLSGDLPYPDPLHILDCIIELEEAGSKPTKTVSRLPKTTGFFRTIRRGFFLGDQTGLKFYKFPDKSKLEVEHSQWWRSASQSLIS